MYNIHMTIWENIKAWTRSGYGFDVRYFESGIRVYVQCPAGSRLSQDNINNLVSVFGKEGTFEWISHEEDKGLIIKISIKEKP